MEEERFIFTRDELSTAAEAYRAWAATAGRSAQVWVGSTANLSDDEE